MQHSISPKDAMGKSLLNLVQPYMYVY
eukprot:COSAG05_NODE_16171_length_352_cov_0.616601_2_plen_26_part_01